MSVDFVLDRTAREPERLYLNALEGDRVIGTGFVDRSSRRGFRPVAITVLRSGAGEAVWAARSSTAASSTRDRFVIWRKPPAAAQPTLGSLQRLCDAAAAVVAKPADAVSVEGDHGEEVVLDLRAATPPTSTHKANDAMRRVNEKLATGRDRRCSTSAARRGRAIGGDMAPRARRPLVGREQSRRAGARVLPAFRRGGPAGAGRGLRHRPAAGPVPARGSRRRRHRHLGRHARALPGACGARGPAAPNLYAQAMHELDLPRRYRTILVCGVFGLGSRRADDLRESAAPLRPPRAGRHARPRQRGALVRRPLALLAEGGPRRAPASVGRRGRASSGRPRAAHAPRRPRPARADRRARDSRCALGRRTAASVKRSTS